MSKIIVVVILVIFISSIFVLLIALILSLLFLRRPALFVHVLIDPGAGSRTETSPKSFLGSTREKCTNSAQCLRHQLLFGPLPAGAAVPCGLHAEV